jgi:cytochrome c-type biogenesis protein CcmH/NrfF
MPALRFKHLRTKLLVWMMAVVFLLTAATLILVQARMRKHVREDLISTLKAQAATFAASENTRQQQKKARH